MMINNDNGAAAMRFTQLGTVSPKQKAAIKVSAKFNSFYVLLRAVVISDEAYNANQLKSTI